MMAQFGSGKNPPWARPDAGGIWFKSFPLCFLTNLFLRALSSSAEFFSCCSSSEHCSCCSWTASGSASGCNVEPGNTLGDSDCVQPEHHQSFSCTTSLYWTSAKYGCCSSAAEYATSCSTASGIWLFIIELCGVRYLGSAIRRILAIAEAPWFGKPPESYNIWIMHCCFELLVVSAIIFFSTREHQQTAIKTMSSSILLLGADYAIYYYIACS